MQPRVFVVVPVFERADHTRACIAQLKRQTHRNVEILIVDGGSRDSSLDEWRTTEGITLIAEIGEQWWTGATWHGVRYALAQGNADDFVLFLNDDTTIPDDLIQVLVEEAGAHHAAVEALQVDDTDHSRVLAAGARFDWAHYRSVPLEPPPPAGGFDARTEVLDGRATIVPLSILREVGNVRRRALPHYCADSELFFRIAKAGHPLAVTHRTWVGIAAPSDAPFSFEPGNFGQVWRSLWDRRSMSNLPAHVTVILLAGPTWGRFRAAAQLVLNATRLLLVAWGPLYRTLILCRRIVRKAIRVVNGWTRHE